MNWALKAVLPIAAVLLNGLLLFVLVSSSLEPDERNSVIAVAAAGAFVICAAVIVVFAVQRSPAHDGTAGEDCARAPRRHGCSVNFADRNDEIGDLGRDFNEMVHAIESQPRRDPPPAPDPDVARRALRHLGRIGRRTGA